jgi:LPXTG-motif cell wall-anchored protein
MIDQPRGVSATSRAPAAVFLTIGVVFVAVGSSGQRAFLAVGAAFIAIGSALLVRKRRADGVK